MKRTNIIGAEAVAGKHVTGEIIEPIGDIQFTEGESRLYQARMEGAKWVYSMYFAQKSMNASKGLHLTVTAGHFTGNTYLDAIVAREERRPGKVWCNNKVPELLPTDKDENIPRHTLYDPAGDAELGVNLSTLGFLVSDYGAGLEALILLEKNAHFYTWEEGDYIFPGSLMTNGNGEWCVPEIRIRDDKDGRFGKSIATHIIPLSAKPKTKKQIVWVRKNTK